MIKSWHDYAWDDYMYWQGQDKKTLKKINKLLNDIERNGESNGIGKPEPLGENMRYNGLIKIFVNRNKWELK